MILKSDNASTAARLSNKTLESLSNQNFQLGYDRDSVKPGILHFSVGNFQRAHHAAYFHDLLQQQQNQDQKWGIIGASIRKGGSYTNQTFPTLSEQDALYTLVQSSNDKIEPHVIGSILECLPVTDHHEPIKAALCHKKNIKIVSMTLTEGGYFVNPSTNSFDKSAEEIQYDAKHPDDPQTVFGLIVQALKYRREHNIQPFTVMSCDNVPHNGDVARNVTVGLAKLIDPDLAKWMQDNVAFPNSMVDRITPATTDELLEKLQNDGGIPYRDDSPVFCEPFRQWIIEDKFSSDDHRPPLDQLKDGSVRFVDDVTPWEDAKLRILNGGHASMCYPAALLGMEYVHEAMKEGSVIDQFVNKLQTTEIVPLVPPVPETDLYDYWKTIRGRYQNATLSDSIDRNCENGSDRQPKFILPSLEDALNNDKNGNDKSKMDGLATVAAMWCKYCLGKSESGDDITAKITDDLWDKLHQTAQKAANGDSKAWLVDLKEVYGDLGKNETFQKSFGQALKTCLDENVETAMQNYIDA
jgi:mannitol 2-dehydrogenase